MPRRSTAYHAMPTPCRAELLLARKILATRILLAWLADGKYNSGMSRKENFHDMFCRVPEVVWEALKKEAERENRSATSQLVHILAKRYKITKSKTADAAPMPG